MNRRQLLKGIGGITLALPWLEALDGGGRAYAQGMNRPRRVVVMTYQMGVPRGVWRPSAHGSAFTLPYVSAPLEPFRSRCLFVSDIDNRMLDAGGSGFSFGHPGKSEAALTGTLTTGAFPTTNTNALSEVRSDAATTGGANSESIEQIIGQALRNGQPFNSVNLGIDGDRRTPASLSSRFFFESRGTAVSMDCSPTSAFNRFFTNVMPMNPGSDQALRELRQRNKSVLDAVRREFTDLRQGLGTDDRRRLDEHAARIREVELIAPPPPACSQPTGITALTNPHMGQVAPMQIRLLAQAMQCNLAPIGRIEFMNQQSPRFGISGLDTTLDGAVAAGYDWHGMVHGDPLPGTSTYLRPGRDQTTTTYDQRLQDSYRFFVQQFANLLTELDRFPEGQGTTVLDNTLCILASDLGEGQGHHHGKMGYVLAGNLGSARRNYHFMAGAANANFYTASTYNVSQLLHSILDMAGVGTGGGGTVAELGLRGYLASIGAPRRIDGLFA
ncbi:MAG: DUF1552 domain-containing protein [Myxococcaceae bacterium]|nr:DUF1552 domain-containing protein [Myxococcaceae bacterium]